MNLMKRPFGRYLIGLVSLMLPALAQAAKPLLDTSLTFAQDGTAKVSQLSYEGTDKDAESNKIESALVFYAIVMNKSDEATRKNLMGAVQAAVGKIATDKGLQRANIIQGSSLIKPLAAAPAPATLIVSFGEEAGQGHSLELKPSDTGNLPMASAVIYIFQDLTKNLSESGLRLLVLAMGGMNKYYREVSPASAPESVSKAPAYGLTLATDIIQNLSGTKSGAKK